MRAKRAIAVILRSAASCVTPALVCAILLLANPRGAGSRTERVILLPKLRAGQTITYEIRFRLDKNIRTQSTVVSPLGPSGEQIDVSGLLRVNVVEVQGAGGRGVIHAQTQFEMPNSDTASTVPEVEPSPGAVQRADPKGKTVEFTIAGDGRVDDVKGLDALIPEQQQAWGEWVSLFAMAATFPEKGVADRFHETCAVILTTAALKQESSRKNATPEDFKLHELQTTGTARGTNQVIAYISLKTGLVVRATAEASQSMDVVVAKTDGTNRVHYNVDAKSNSEVLLVAERPLAHP